VTFLCRMLCKSGTPPSGWVTSFARILNQACRAHEREPARPTTGRRLRHQGRGGAGPWAGGCAPADAWELGRHSRLQTAAALPHHDPWGNRNRGRWFTSHPHTEDAGGGARDVAAFASLPGQPRGRVRGNLGTVGGMALGTTNDAAVPRSQPCSAPRPPAAGWRWCRGVPAGGPVARRICPSAGEPRRVDLANRGVLKGTGVPAPLPGRCGAPSTPSRAVRAARVQKIYSLKVSQYEKELRPLFVA
jgi:hypothetical protein